jgi:CopG family nickel-responsive transcriptional regulator
MKPKGSVARISLSLPPELLERFDDIAAKSGFADRSKAVQATIRNFISDEKHSLTPNQRVTAVIIVVYNHEARGIDAILTDIEHEIGDKISSSSHVHLGVTHCLKIIVLKGNMTEVTTFEKAVRKLNGVMQLKAIFVKTEMDSS